MTDKKPRKPVTFEDYIPPDPDPDPASLRDARRRELSERERETLESLEASLDKDEAKSKPKKKPGFWTAVFWIVVLVVIANWVD